MDAALLRLHHVVDVREHAALLVHDAYADRVGGSLDPECPHPFGIALRAKAFGPPRGLLTAAALRPAHVRPGSRTAPVRVSPDPREPDDRGGPAARPRRHVRHRTDCRGARGPLASRRPLLRTPRAGPCRDGRIQAQPDIRIRERDRGLSPALAPDPR